MNLRHLFILVILLAVKTTWGFSADEIKRDTVQFTLLIGEEIEPYSKSLAQLVLAAFKEYPYLYAASDHYVDYLESYDKNADSLVILMTDEGSLVGVATGIPMTASGKYQIPFLEKGWDVSKMLYMGELVLDPNYRQKGLGKKLFQELENAARLNQYDEIGLCQIEDDRYEALKPLDYISTNGFWSKLGFQHHPDINLTANWVNVDDSEKTPHHMVYWTKKLFRRCGTPTPNIETCSLR